jgi:lysozyme family protein
MLLTFEEIVEWVLAREGAPAGKDGRVDDPRDVGGLTRFGLAQRYHPELDVASITREQAVAVYKMSYWLPLDGGNLPGPMRLLAFDSAVNCGVTLAKSWLAQAQTAEDYRWLRVGYYRSRPAARPAALAFLPGWIRRLELERQVSR